MSKISHAILVAFAITSGITFGQDKAPAPLSAADAAQKMQLPKGFHASVFAAEPDIVQPIAMAIDARGRLWVVECQSYPNWQDINVEEGSDRVLIFEDTDGDGKHDKRTVFLENGRNLTGIELGSGGVYLCSSPDLIFIADSDRNDMPDGPAEILLSGFCMGGKHNVVNGLHWGPDGWLYGLHGITQRSEVTNPLHPDAKAITMDCGVWRFHPTHKRFEPVCFGSTNPWGLDWNSVGQSFITNCVIEHIFHVIPGARFKRMKGQDTNPYVYSLMDSCADHIHWAGGFWDVSIGGKHDDAGGGHAHCGGMIYLGDNWPDEYRDKMYLVNIHGRRVNCDRLVASDDTYVAQHDDDFLLAADPFFRGVEMKYGPDGAAYLLDWNDTGECHDFVDIHTETGRIFKIAYGTPKPWSGNLETLTDAELLDLQAHKNEWFVRRSRDVMRDRNFASNSNHKEASPEFARELTSRWETEKDPLLRLRYMWCLASCDLLTPSMLSQLSNGTLNERLWALRLLGRFAPGEVQLSQSLLHDSRGLILQEKASATIRGAKNLLSPQSMSVAVNAINDAKTRKRIDQLVWLAVESSIDPQTIQNSHHDQLLNSVLDIINYGELSTESTAQKLATLGQPGLVLEAAAHERCPPALQDPLLQGLLQSLRGQHVQPPVEWQTARKKLLTGEIGTASLGYELGLIFGDTKARETLTRSFKENANSKAFELLMQYPDASAKSLVEEGLKKTNLRLIALKSLAVSSMPDVADKLISDFATLQRAEQETLVAALVSRRDYAMLLLSAIEQNKVPASSLTSVVVSQLSRIKDARLQEKLTSIYGRVGVTDRNRKSKINRVAKFLTKDALHGADRISGKLVFEKKCGTCHKLYGQGGQIGPDLTGGQRKSVEYFLENVIAPNTLVPQAFRVRTVQTIDGRVISGIVESENEKRIVLQTPTDKVIVPASDIDYMKATDLSLMPEGLLDDLSTQQIIDMVAYFQGDASDGHHHPTH